MSRHEEPAITRDSVNAGLADWAPAEKLVFGKLCSNLPPSPPLQVSAPSKPTLHVEETGAQVHMKCPGSAAGFPALGHGAGSAYV
jgi:hypothetical protein